MADKGEKSGFGYLDTALFGFVVIGTLIFFWPDLIPFRYFEFWTIKAPIWEAVKGAWWVFAWGILVNIFFLVTRRSVSRANPGEVFIIGTAISIWAGVAEEICFRWLIFFSAIVLIPFSDWLLLGFMGVHIVQWVYGILCMIANFATFGYLDHYLHNGWGWAAGAAIISSNGRFRDGHGYQGLFGVIQAWFFGMYMFWVVFNYGIVAAIIIHFLFDFFIFSLAALSAIGGNRRQWT